MGQNGITRANLEGSLRELMQFACWTQAGKDECADYLERWLTRRGIACTRYRVTGGVSLVAEIGPSDGPVLVLHGHYDTLEPSGTASEPADGWFAGTGAADMKAGIACLLWATDALHRRGGVRVRLVFTPDEETHPGRTPRELRRRCAPEGWGAFVVTAEPTRGVGVQAMGASVLTIKVLGTAAHAARPHEGVNAIGRAYDDIRPQIAALPFAAPTLAYNHGAALNVLGVTSKCPPNQVPDEAWMRMTVRFPSPWTVQDVKSQIAGLDGVHEVRSFRTIAPVVVDPDHPYVRAVLQAIGEDGWVEAREGASDLCGFGRVPGVEWGPWGIGHHGGDERVNLASMLRNGRALYRFGVAFPDVLERTSA